MLRDKKVIEFRNKFSYSNIEANIDFLNKTQVLNRNLKILEIGVGLGNLLKYFLDQGYNIEGVDINKKLIEKGNQLHGNLPVKLIDSEILPYADNSFDIIISFDVFEHIANSDNHLSEVKRVLKNNGFYLLQTPNKYTNTIFEIIQYRSFTSWRKNHCSLHSYKEIIKRFNKNGFKVEFLNIPVVNEFFKTKIQLFFGKYGLFILGILNPDKFPMNFKTNFYIKSQLSHSK